jgi:hypothetical protein
MEELVPEVPIVTLVSTWVYGPQVARFTVDHSVSEPWPALDAIAVTT